MYTIFLKTYLIGFPFKRLTGFNISGGLQLSIFHSEAHFSHILPENNLFITTFCWIFLTKNRWKIVQCWHSFVILAVYLPLLLPLVLGQDAGYPPEQRLALRVPKPPLRVSKAFSSSPSPCPLPPPPDALPRPGMTSPGGGSLSLQGSYWTSHVLYS